jgi:hypothetical protein
MSKPITIDIPHQLGAAEAKRRIDQGFSTLLEQVGGAGLARVSRSWEGDRMTFSVTALGQLISGHLLIMNDMVRMEVQLPALLMSFAQAIRARMQTQGQILLGKK